MSKGTLCDEPLLQNSTKFLDTIFSAIDWCPKSSGTQYLQIDLQRAFFISHIATFGDVGDVLRLTIQSHFTKARIQCEDEGMLRYISCVKIKYTSDKNKTFYFYLCQINANGDAYGVSITVLNIVYVRFLKITVQNGDAVCIIAAMVRALLYFFLIKFYLYPISNQWPVFK